MRKPFTHTSTLLLLLAACGPDPAAPSRTDGKGTAKSDSPERIDNENDPNRFRLTMVRKLTELPSTGESLRKPFPSNWWPMRQGGIARRWNGADPSPAEKYDLLVTPDQVRDIELTLAKKNWKGEPVNPDAMPETLHVGPAAEWEHRNHGRYGDKDPDSWWGHCNGWASYVLNEDEPLRPVSVRFDRAQNRIVECATAAEPGCVRFEVGDINALGAEIYWHDAARMLGRRCEQETSEFNFDDAGRINAVECRDGNAGSFHLIAANMLGRMTRPFILDLNADFQVWNYPVYRFEITRNQEITVEEALREVGAPATMASWEYNRDARRWIRVELKAWIVEDAIPPSTQPAGTQLERYTTIEYYDYVLELDSDGNIVGGEWVGRSKTFHPDFLWYSYGNSAYGASSDDLWDGDNPGLRYSYFKQILTLAQQPVAPPPPPPSGDVVRLSRALGTAIPDNDATGITSAIDVAESFSANRVRVTVNITHTYRGDLVVSLERGGQSIVLHAQTGGSEDNLVQTFEVPGLAAQSVAGRWVLRVADLARQDLGTWNSWELELTRGSGAGGGGGTGGGGSNGALVLNATPNASIPDNSPNGVSSSLEVTESLSPSRVRVTVDIAHSYRGDLLVSLARNGRSITLHDRAGGSADDLRQTFEVADLVGQDARGTWTLVVADTASADTGTLRSWSLELTRGTGGGSGGTGGGSVTREYSASPRASIPDNDSNGLRSTIAVGDSIRISDLRVEVNITHTYIGDLKVTLSNGTATQTLHANAGGSARNIHETYQTAAFRNGSAQGTWTLEVTDNAGQDVGTLDSWKLIVTGASQ